MNPLTHPCPGCQAPLPNTWHPAYNCFVCHALGGFVYTIEQATRLRVELAMKEARNAIRFLNTPGLGRTYYE